MKRVYIGLGTNLGNREQNLESALSRIAEVIGIIIARSSVYETEPWGFLSENKFLNMVIAVDTDLSPSGLLGRLLMIESLLGRLRSTEKYTSRTIDLDILLYGKRIIDTIALKIPHPRMPQRKFVLVPLSEIASDYVHPVLKKRISVLLDECKDKGSVTKFQ